jgi:hypothetical protein
MADTNTLYEIGGLPSVADDALTWPSAGAENFLMNGGSDSNAAYLHYSFGAGVRVPGGVIFGSTGEANITNQLTKLTLSADAPAWGMFTQPEYPTSEAEAVTMDSDWYYSAADYAALPSGDKIDGVGEAAFSAAWDGTFPVGHLNWVIRRKYTSGGPTGESRPWFFRYQMPVYIPPAMTGTATGAIITTNFGTIYGPFSQGAIPGGGGASTDTNWFADVYGSGRRKKYLWATDVSTGVAQRLSAEMPDVGNQGVVNMPVAMVDGANKRIYYWLVSSSNNALMYADFSAGLAGVTFSGPTAMTDLSSGTAPSLGSNGVFCVPASGPNAGKRLYFCREQSSQEFVLIDIDANTIRNLAVSGVPGSGDWWCWGYHTASNTVFITTKSVADGVRCYRFVIPTDYTNAANYSVTMDTIAMNGISLESAGDTGPYQYGDRTDLLDEYGVLLLTQKFNKAVAFRPSGI